MSSADSDLCSALLGDNSGDLMGWSDLSRKGFREAGLCRVDGSSNGEVAVVDVVVGDAKAASMLMGEAARLRKGLLDDKLTERPGEG